MAALCRKVVCVSCVASVVMIYLAQYFYLWILFVCSAVSIEEENQFYNLCAQIEENILLNLWLSFFFFFFFFLCVCVCVCVCV